MQVKLSSRAVEEMIFLSRIFKQVNLNKEFEKEIFIRPLQQSFEDNQVIDLPELTKNKEQILNDAYLEAKEISERAQSDYDNTLKNIEQMKQDFEVEKEKITQQTKDEAYKVGLEEGRESGYLEYTGLLAEANQIVEQSKVAFKDHVESSEKTILELALVVAERILTKQLQQDANDFIPVVKQALKEMSDFKEIQIHVHPNQYEALLEQKDEIDAVLQRDTKSFIYVNEDVKEFTCMIESEKGKIDATISTQLIEMKSKLMELLVSEDE